MSNSSEKYNLISRINRKVLDWLYHTSITQMPPNLSRTGSLRGSNPQTTLTSDTSCKFRAPETTLGFGNSLEELLELTGSFHVHGYSF